MIAQGNALGIEVQTKQKPQRGELTTAGDRLFRPFMAEKTKEIFESQGDALG